MKLKCKFLDEDMEDAEIKFDSYAILGRWVADNAEGILIQSVEREEE